MPPIRFLASVRHILLAASISLNSKIINPYSYYEKKGLVYITIIALFSRQPSSYFKCTKANTYSLLHLFILKELDLQVVNQRCAVSYINLITFFIPDISYQIFSIYVLYTISYIYFPKWWNNKSLFLLCEEGVGLYYYYSSF